MKGVFITFEGSEGSGKSTQARLICDYLRDKGLSVLYVREPGGVRISESIRRILLDVHNTGMGDECEVLLYMAARSQLVEEVIFPGLKSGKIVLCDRYIDSTFAYQGYGNGVEIEYLKQIGRFATRGLLPKLTLLFDIETKIGLERTGRNKDRIERRALVYHQRVRRGYLQLAVKEPGRIKVIKANGSKEEIHREVRFYIDQAIRMIK